MSAGAVGESRTFHEPATRLLTLLRLAREVLSVFRLARDAPAVISFGEGRVLGIPFGEGESAGFPFGEPRETRFRQNRPHQTRFQQIGPRQTRFQQETPRQMKFQQIAGPVSWRFREQWPCERTAAAGRVPCVLRRTLPCWKHPPQHTTSARRVQKRKSAAPPLPSLVRFCTRGAESDGGAAAHASRPMAAPNPYRLIRAFAVTWRLKPCASVKVKYVRIHP
jgi:hypothetical protein